MVLPKCETKSNILALEHHAEVPRQKSGSVDLEYGTQIERLKAGDCAYFDAHVEHRLINPSKRPAQVLCVFGGRN